MDDETSPSRKIHPKTKLPPISSTIEQEAQEEGGEDEGGEKDDNKVVERQKKSGLQIPSYLDSKRDSKWKAL